MIKALIFDLDNTLINRQKAFKEMLYRVIGEYYNDQELINQMVEDIIEYDYNGKNPRIESFTKWVNKYHVTAITPEQFADNWANESGSVAYLYDDVRPTLTKLRERYKIAVLSNGKPLSQRKKMKTIAIDDLLDYSLISGEYGIDKPDRRVFDYVCSQMNLKNEECVYIGDTYAIDVVGARNAGLETIYVSRAGETHEDVKTIYEIKDLLEIF